MPASPASRRTTRTLQSRLIGTYNAEYVGAGRSSVAQFDIASGSNANNGNGDGDGIVWKVGGALDWSSMSNPGDVCNVNRQCGAAETTVQRSVACSSGIDELACNGLGTKPAQVIGRGTPRLSVLTISPT